jgi:phage-related holin
VLKGAYLMDLTLVLMTILTNVQVKYLLALVLAVLVAGVAASLKNRTFRLGNVADVVETHLLPVLLAYVAVAAIAWANPDLVVVQTIVFGIIVAKLVAEVMENLAEMGINIPPSISQRWTGITLTQPAIEVVGDQTPWAKPTGVATSLPPSSEKAPTPPAVVDVVPAQSPATPPADPPTPVVGTSILSVFNSA